MQFDENFFMTSIKKVARDDEAIESKPLEAQQYYYFFKSATTRKLLTDGQINFIKRLQRRRQEAQHDDIDAVQGSKRDALLGEWGKATRKPGGADEWGNVLVQLKFDVPQRVPEASERVKREWSGWCNKKLRALRQQEKHHC